MGDCFEVKFSEPVSATWLSNTVKQALRVTGR